MAQISINVPDAVLPRVLDAFAFVFGYQASDGSKAAFTRRQVALWVIGIVRMAESQAAQAAASAKADAEIAIT